MLKENKSTFLITALLFCGAVLCYSFGILQSNPRLQQKIDSAVKGTYEIEAYTLEPITVSDAVNQQTKAELSGEHLYRVVSNNKALGFIYVGEAPSMKKKFDYILLFNPDLSIKKSKVLIYRENYGLQIGSQRWLKQFIGLDINDTLKYGENIDAIAGATISASSLTKATDQVLQSLKLLKEQSIL